MNEKVAGAIFRSKSQYYNEGEKNSAYFYSLEKARSGAKNMITVVDDDGRVFKDPMVIMNKMSKFYEELYTADREAEFTYENTSGIKIDESDKMLLDSEISIEDIKSAIKDTKRGKALGLDGLTIEFYIVFFEKLGRSLHEVLVFGLQQGQLHNMATKGLLSLIPKQNQGHKEVKMFKASDTFERRFQNPGESFCNMTEGGITEVN